MSAQITDYSKKHIWRLDLSCICNNRVQFMRDVSSAGLKAEFPNLSLEVTGYVNMAVTIAVWVGFSLSARYLTPLHLGPADAACLRFGLPALVFLPFLKSRIAAIGRLKPKVALMVFIGGGLPFYLLAAQGASMTSAAISGALIPGGSLLFVNLFEAVTARRMITGRKALGLVLTALGLFTVTAASLSHMPPAELPRAMSGVGILLLSGALWAVFSLGIRHSGLDPIGCSLVQSLPSVLIMIPLIGLQITPVHMQTVDLAQLWPFILAHGIGTGLLTGLCYAGAIRNLGVVKAAALGSLAPAIIALSAAWLLGEAVTPVLMLGAVAISAGVIVIQTAQTR
jgi:drug/metabolite transporter (DMT)-like permease